MYVEGLAQNGQAMQRGRAQTQIICALPLQTVREEAASADLQACTPFVLTSLHSTVQFSQRGVNHHSPIFFVEHTVLSLSPIYNEPIWG